MAVIEDIQHNQSNINSTDQEESSQTKATIKRVHTNKNLAITRTNNPGHID